MGHRKVSNGSSSGSNSLSQRWTSVFPKRALGRPWLRLLQVAAVNHNNNSSFSNSRNPSRIHSPAGVQAKSICFAQPQSVNFICKHRLTRHSYSAEPELCDIFD